MNLLCERLGITIPILQAPTGSIAGPELVSAVSGAGGLGGMGLTWTAGEAAVQMVWEVRAAILNPFFVNYALSFRPDTLNLVLKAGAPIITFSWGDPTPWMGTVRAAGVIVGVQVGNVAGARMAVNAGADFIICQGLEAGGHVQSTTERDLLLSQVIAAVGRDVPIVAAGGLSTASDIAVAMRLGADGVMLGTRFVATRESRAHTDYKNLLIKAENDSTVLTVCFDGGWPHAPHRVLRNSTQELWESAGCPPPGKRPEEGATVASAASGEPILRYEDTGPRMGMTGNVEAMALYAGTGVGAINDLPKAGELVQRLWSETQELMNAKT
jgi:NAD(P)H-dependent flavin oxidoreductase YrpB (nitropropane dioxygenase family)